MIMVNTNANNGTWSDETFEVASVPLLKGDVDFNQMIDIADTMQLVAYAIGNEALYSSTMDVNADGDVNVTDVMAVVSMILKR